MGERLTIEELRERYDGEWVALSDVETDENDEIVAARAFAHGASSDAVHAAIQSAGPGSYAVECFQRLPEGWILAL